MDYQAIFEIDCGVSQGFALKFPYIEKRIETITANNSEIACQKVMELANKFADDYLSNPDTNLTSVKLLSLKSSDGTVSLNAKQTLVEKSTFEHISALTD